MNLSYEYLCNELQEYRKWLLLQQEELNNMPEGALLITDQGGTVNYMMIKPDDSGEIRKYKRTVITRNSGLIAQLARKKYLKIYIKELEAQIKNLERFIKSYRELIPENILKKLPEPYQKIPRELFFPQKKADEEWALQEYEQNRTKPLEKKHITSRGLRVRSKSELLIAEKLYAYNIPFRYEPMLYYKQYALSPDFQFRINNEYKYLEHCGMMMNPQYREHNKWKLEIYEKMGIVPWKNLIITYDNIDGNIDMRIIEAEIRNKLMK